MASTSTTLSQSYLDHPRTANNPQDCRDICVRNHRSLPTSLGWSGIIMQSPSQVYHFPAHPATLCCPVLPRIAAADPWGSCSRREPVVRLTFCPQHTVLSVTGVPCLPATVLPDEDGPLSQMLPSDTTRPRGDGPGLKNHASHAVFGDTA